MYSCSFLFLKSHQTPSRHSVTASLSSTSPTKILEVTEEIDRCIAKTLRDPLSIASERRARTQAYKKWAEADADKLAAAKEKRFPLFNFVCLVAFLFARW